MQQPFSTTCLAVPETLTFNQAPGLTISSVSALRAANFCPPKLDAADAKRLHEWHASGWSLCSFALLRPRLNLSPG
jgi:hypothetical protein